MFKIFLTYFFSISFSLRVNRIIERKWRLHVQHLLMLASRFNFCFQIYRFVIVSFEHNKTRCGICSFIEFILAAATAFLWILILKMHHNQLLGGVFWLQTIRIKYFGLPWIVWIRTLNTSDILTSGLNARLNGVVLFFFFSFQTVAIHMNNLQSWSLTRGNVVACLDVVYAAL